MFLRTVVAISLVLFLAGCATTSTTPKNQTRQVNSQIKELQDRIYLLEQELQSRVSEIGELETELEKIRTIEISKTETAPIANLSVRQIQTALKNAGFYQGEIDGKLGAQTKSAIEQFQEAHGLKVDGIVGRRTTIELNKYLNK